MSIIELIAVVFSLLYVILAAKENSWCWLCAAISVTLYIYICFTAKLYPETGLQLFYLFMAGYGYWQWNKPKKELPIQQWSNSKHLGVLAIGALLTYACLLYTSPSPRDKRQSRMPSSA